jgi:chromosome segregation ATPase
MFDVLIKQGELDLKGGAPKQRLSMKGGARKLYDDATQVVFKKETADKLREQMTDYQSRFKLLNAEIDALKKSSQSSVATTDSDAMKTLAAKLIALQTLYKESQNNLTNEKIANAANQGIALKLQASLKNPASSASPASLTNASVIADLTKENDNLKKENADIKTAKGDLENAKTTLETENAGLKLDKTGLDAEKATLETENNNLKTKNTTLETENANLKDENANLTNAKATLEVEKTNLTSENASLKTTNANLTSRLNSTSTASGMSTAISTARSTLPRNPKVFISDNGRVMFSEHK